MGVKNKNQLRYQNYIIIRSKINFFITCNIWLKQQQNLFLGIDLVDSNGYVLTKMILCHQVAFLTLNAIGIRRYDGCFSMDNKVICYEFILSQKEFVLIKQWTKQFRTIFDINFTVVFVVSHIISLIFCPRKFMKK